LLSNLTPGLDRTLTAVSQGRQCEAGEVEPAPLPTEQRQTVCLQIRQPQHRLSAAEVRALVVAYQDGQSIAALARDFRLNKSTVRAQLLRAGVELRPQAVLTPEQVAEVLRRYKAGSTLKQLGPQFGVGHNTIRNYLLKEGVQLRGAWRQPVQPSRS
jgi:lambda repressor-like predicted transcriptional regulator